VNYKYYIGEVGYKTKKDCLEYTRNVINSLGCGKINKDHYKLVKNKRKF
jgi:hypothetical protein